MVLLINDAYVQTSSLQLDGHRHPGRPGANNQCQWLAHVQLRFEKLGWIGNQANFKLARDQTAGTFQSQL
jgi:hypothetical protein